MTAIAGHVMLHHKFYQNQLIQISPDKKSGLFYAIHVKQASKRSTLKNKNANTTTQTIQPAAYADAVLERTDFVIHTL
jgi:hypothetical protein